MNLQVLLNCYLKFYQSGRHLAAEGTGPPRNIGRDICRLQCTSEVFIDARHPEKVKEGTDYSARGEVIQRDMNYKFQAVRSGFGPGFLIPEKEMTWIPNSSRRNVLNSRFWITLHEVTTR